MNIAGIVAEYNPFHAGHAYHIAQTRARLGDCAVVAVMSGNFVQRGDCALQDKWSRARAALEGGADLVLELPTVWACASAEHFAGGAAALLQAAGVGTLSFGSESGDAPLLARVADCLDGEAFSLALRRQLDRGLSFARCRQRAAEELMGTEASCLLGANDNLGVEYLRAARRLGWTPEVLAVPWVGAGHDGGDHPAYPSASHLREKILAGELPMDNPASLGYNERGVLSLLRALPPEAFEALPDGGEGLARRLYQAVRRGRSLDEIYDLAKTKRYAHARIRRMTLWACLGLREGHRPEVPPYLRVLGCTERGRAVLRSLETGLPVITKPAQGRRIPLLELEARCTDFFGLCRRDGADSCGREWTTSPVIL